MIPIIDGLGDGWTTREAQNAIDDALGGENASAYHLALTGLMLTHLLLKKNAAYGDSALNPLSVFSKAEVRDRLAIRMDDKLNRIAKGHAFGMENERIDLAGYLILDYIAGNTL